MSTTTQTAKTTWKRSTFVTDDWHEHEQTRYTLHVDGKPTNVRIDRETEQRMGGAPSHSFTTFRGEEMIAFSETLQWAKYDVLTSLGYAAKMPRHG